MNVINIEIKNKIAQTTGDVKYVCGNSDYLISFSFDEEWDEHDIKTARIINGDGEYYDVVFKGSECTMPIISNAYAIKIGVFAGNLHTTTPAYVPAVKSILCDGGAPADPPEDVYNQIMEKLDSLTAGGVEPEQIQAAVDAYLQEHPVEGVTEEEVRQIVDEALPEPYSLPVASADTLGGVKVGNGVHVAADGTLSVNGGSEDAYELIETVTFSEAMAFTRTQEPDGTPYKFSRMMLLCESPAGEESWGYKGTIPGHERISSHRQLGGQ